MDKNTSSAAASDGLTADGFTSGQLINLSIGYSLATNGVTIAPIIVAVLMERLGITEAHAGNIAGIELLGLVLACLIFPYVARGYARCLSWVGGIGALLMHLTSGLANSPGELAIFRGVAGVFEGMIFVCVAASIARRPSAERIWGLVILISGVLNSLLLLVLSYMPMDTLIYWAFAVIALFTSAGLPFSIRIHKLISKEVVVNRSVSMRWGAVALIWMMLFLLTAVQAAQWAVAGVLGKHIGLPLFMVGMLLAVSSLLGFFGSGVPAVAALFRHRLKIIVISFVLMGISVCWFFNSLDSTNYFLSQVFLNLGFYAILPYLNGYLSELDEKGALVALTYVVVLLGAAAGTGFAGDGLTAAGLRNFGPVLALMLLPCVFLAVPAFRNKSYV